MVGDFKSVWDELGNVLLLEVPCVSQRSFLADASVRLFKTSMYGFRDACVALSCSSISLKARRDSLKTS